MIPKRINFVWIGDPLPPWAQKNIAEFERLNPGYEIAIHDERALLPSLQNAYQAAVGLAGRSDLIRYSVLSREGGWYFDVDFWPLRPLDDAVRAWQLDGGRLFISKQKGNRNSALPYANGVLACAPGCPAIADLIEAVIDSAGCAMSRTTYGPQLLVKRLEDRPEQFIVSNAGWWFPLAQRQIEDAYPYLTAGQTGTLALDPETGGHLPFGVHLWAHANDLTAMAASASTGEPMPTAIVASASRAAHPLNAAAAGLERCGYRVERASDPDGITGGFVAPKVVVVWNGRRRDALAMVQEARRVDALPLILEHGFYQRQDYTQVDHEGILHWASWRCQLNDPAPYEAAERFARFYPGGTRRIEERPDGYILVLGQVSGDTQMAESEMTGPVELQNHLARALPQGAPAFFRPHPSCSNVRQNPRHVLLPLLHDVEGQQRVDYLRTKHGAGLAADLLGARFVITINSNAINEALAAGVPCLAFGPHLGIVAGVVRQATRATLQHDIADMMRGWMPHQEAVDNYLRWLAARQWDNEELSAGGVLADLIEAARPTGRGAPFAAHLPAEEMMA